MRETKAGLRRLRRSLRVVVQLYVLALLIKLTPDEDFVSLNLMLRLNKSIH